MKTLRFGLLLLGLALAIVSSAQAQSDAPLAIVVNADGAIMPAMQEYITRGIETAEQRNAEVLIIQLNTPGGNINTMQEIVEAIRASEVPVVVYVAPRGAWAGSAGTMITLAAHAAAMAPETVIGAASPVSGEGADLDQTMERKVKEATKAQARSLAERRGPEAVKLAEATIEEAAAVSSKEALEAGLIDFIAEDLDDLLRQLDGFTVEMISGPRALNTANAETGTLKMSFIEELLMLLTNPAIVLVLVGVGIQALLIEISSPGGWVAGFFGVVCIVLGVYGAGYLPLNLFGAIFIVTAFALFILDVKAPTHGALTAAGIASFVVGALVLFNSPGTPQFARVSIPVVVLVAVFIGITFGIIVGFAVRAMRVPVRAGAESYVGKTGTARTSVDEAGGQVQLESELWSAESVPGSEEIRKGDHVEVVEVKGLRLKVRKK
jgi:membrane-bound serine protease (ClpP class)